MAKKASLFLYDQSQIKTILSVIRDQTVNFSDMSDSDYQKHVISCLRENSMKINNLDPKQGLYKLDNDSILQIISSTDDFSAGKRTLRIILDDFENFATAYLLQNSPKMNLAIIKVGFKQEKTLDNEDS